MTRVRLYVLETGVAACFFSGIFIFGGVYAWSFMPACAVLFYLLLRFPEAVTVPSLSFFQKTLIAVLSAFLFFQIFFSLSPQSTAAELIKWLALWAAFFLVQLFPRSAIMRLFMVFTAAGILESLYGAFQVRSGIEKVLWQAKETHRGWLTGTYFNRNHAAGLLELSFGPALALGVAAFSKHKRAVAFTLFPVFILLLTGLFFTGSRMGIFSFFLSFLLLAFFAGSRLRKPVLVLTGIFLTLGIAAAVAAGPQLFQRFGILLAGNWDGGRLTIWKNTMAMLRDYPWTGIGLGAFRWVFPAYQSAKFTMGWPHAHQDYLELLVCIGIPAFAVLSVLFFSFACSFFKLWKQADPGIFLLILGPAVSLLSFLFHGFADFNFAIPGNALAFSILAGSAFRLLQLSGAAHE